MLLFFLLLLLFICEEWFLFFEEFLVLFLVIFESIVENFDFLERLGFKRWSIDKVVLVIVVLEGKLGGEEFCFFGLVFFVKYGESFIFFSEFFFWRESVVKERLDFYKWVFLLLNFVVLFDRNNVMVLYLRCIGLYFLYSYVKWKFNICKEVS